jgi:hypothetical protein
MNFSTPADRQGRPAIGGDKPERIPGGTFVINAGGLI